MGSTFTVWVSLKVPSSPGPEPVAPEDLSGAALRRASEATRWLEDGMVVPAGVRESMLGPGSSMPGPRAHVLVVDDNADMRDYLGRTLGNHWRVTVAREGNEALELARREPFDLILADVMMPGLDGFGLLRALRADEELKTTPLVLMTARAHEGAAIEGLLAGADDYVTKPFSSRELVARIGAQLQLARVRRQGEREVRDLLALMPVGVYALDPDGRFSYWNRRAAELWGGEPQRDDVHWAMTCGPAARTGSAAVTPETSPMAHVLLSREGVTDEELTIVRADGSTVDVLVNVRQLRDPQGEPAGAVCTFVDITARKQATAALRDSDERRRALVATMAQGYAEAELVRDAHGEVAGVRWLDANPAFARMFGASPDWGPWWLGTFERIAQADGMERVEHETGAGHAFAVQVYPRGSDRLTLLCEERPTS